MKRMKRPTFLSLFFSLFYLWGALARKATVQLDEDHVSNCLSSTPCDFLNNGIWSGGYAPSTGDNVIMSLSGNKTAYITLDDEIDLNSLQMTGPVVFSIDTSFTISIDSVSLNSLSLLHVADANLLVNQATITSASLQLSGNANFTAIDFNSTGSHLFLLDTSILQGDAIWLDNINATSSANFIWNNVTFLSGVANISCPVNISVLTTAPQSQATILGGNLGSVTMLANSNLYTYNDITVSNLALTAGSVFFGTGNIVFDGSISGAGTLQFANSEVFVGNQTDDSVQLSLLSISLQLYGVTNATFYNVQFGKVLTPTIPNQPQQVTLNLYGATFSVSTAFTANIYSTSIGFHGIGINITGAINSTGTFTVMTGGVVNITEINHVGGSVALFAPVIVTNYFAIDNSSLDITAPIYGGTNLTQTLIQTDKPIFFYGSLSISSCNFSVPEDLSIYVGGDVNGEGFSTLSGNFTAASYTFGGGQLTIQGSLSGTTAVFRDLIFTTENTTTLNCSAIAMDASIINVISPLIVYGNLVLHSFEITSENNQTLFVNGSLYSFGNSSISSSVNLVASTFTHIGDHVYVQGTITAEAVSFVNADIFIAAPLVLSGNTSMSNSVIRLHAGLSVRGSLFLSSTIQSAGVQKVDVNTSIICTGDSYIYDLVRVYTPYYSQESGSLHLFGILSADSINILKGAILSTKMPNVIYGNVHVQGGLLEFHNATNITGSLILDVSSQTMLYNFGANYPIVQVDGSLHLNGALVYWINPAPIPNKPIMFKVFTYSSDLQGRFASYDAYAPNKPSIKMLKFNLIYGDKDIRLEYNPAKQLGVGAVVGIVLGSVVGVTALVIVGLIYYRRYRKRQKYTTIEKFEAEIDRFISN